MWLIIRFYNVQLPSIGSGRAGVDRVININTGRRQYLPVYPDHWLCYTQIYPSGFTYLFLALKFEFKRSICQYLSSLFSNVFRLGVVTISSVRIFHKFVILKLKKLFLTFSLEYDLATLSYVPILYQFCLVLFIICVQPAWL